MGNRGKRIVYAPWTDKQIAILKKWQNNPQVHPYTCDEGHVLVPYKHGWMCATCRDLFKQNWCHAFHFEEGN